VDASGTIYTKRYGDLNIHTAALQIFLTKDRVKAFDDFTYEHVTRTSRAAYSAKEAAAEAERLAKKMSFHRVSNASAYRAQASALRDASARETAVAVATLRRAGVRNPTDTAAAPAMPTAMLAASSGTDDEVIAADMLLQDVMPAQCIDFGGIAAGRADPHGYQRVLEMARGLEFCRPPCLRVFLSDIRDDNMPITAPRPPKRLVLAATANAVKVEKHGCGQNPPPYYCVSGSNFAGSGLSFAEKSETASEKRAATASDDVDEAAELGQPTVAVGKTAAGEGRRLLSHRRVRLSNETSTARWAQWASESPLGTCNLPPAVYKSRCGTVIHFIRAHPARHNLLTGIHFHCASSIFRFLVACRPESGCVRPADHLRWYRGHEAIDCNERAMLKHEPQARASGMTAVSSVADTGVSERHGGHSHLWARHECQKLSVLPPAAEASAAHEMMHSMRARKGTSEGGGGGAVRGQHGGRAKRAARRVYAIGHKGKGAGKLGESEI